jgi:hypothetical protein
VTNQDLTFKVPFKLQAKRNDFIHALIAFFEVEFNKCHKPIRFSTGTSSSHQHNKLTSISIPKTQITFRFFVWFWDVSSWYALHTLETVCFLFGRYHLHLSWGVDLRNTLCCVCRILLKKFLLFWDFITHIWILDFWNHISHSPNKKNPRDLDIEISIKFQGMNGSVNRTQQYKLRWDHLIQRHETSQKEEGTKVLCTKQINEIDKENERSSFSLFGKELESSHFLILTNKQKKRTKSSFSEKQIHQLETGV